MRATATLATSRVLPKQAQTFTEAGHSGWRASVNQLSRDLSIHQRFIVPLTEW
jgi:hypothetical protein